MNKTWMIFLMVIVQVVNMLAQELNYVSERIEIESAILTENRQIELYYPKEKSDALIAFYILDGNWNHDLVRGTIAHWVKWNLMPDVIVVSIDNMGKRTRDLTPTKDNIRFPGSGGAQSFLEFVSKELRPKMEKEFENIEFKILIGHSFGGLFSLFALKEQPDLFDGYIAVSPSVWWKEKYMYQPFNFDTSGKKPFVYITAGTNDRGNTTASKEYVSWLQTEGLSQKMELHSDIMEGEDHFSNVPITLHSGINLLFPKQKWNSEILSAYSLGGLSEAQKKAREFRQSYGVRFLFPSEVLLAKALSLHQEGKSQEAVELLNWVQAQDAPNYQPSYYLAHIFKKENNKNKAVESYQNALRIGGMPDRMKIVIQREIEQLQPTTKKMPVFSTNEVETSIAFMPDETIAYVSRHNGKWGSRENPPSKIYEYRKAKGKWQLKGISPFSQEGTEASDSDIFISYDGKEAFFISTRKYEGKRDTNPDIWRSTLQNGAWSKPEPILEVNSLRYEASPVTDAQGNLYFSSIRDGGEGLGDFYVAKRKTKGVYGPPQPLKGDVNEASGEWNLMVSPTADWMLFESSGREEGLSGYGDLYFSSQQDRAWSKPIPVKELNSTGSDLNIRYLPNTKKLVFVSSKALENTDTDVFEIDFKTIETYINKTENK